MLWTRSELKGRAKFLLKQNYWYSVLAALIYTFLWEMDLRILNNVLKIRIVKWKHRYKVFIRS